MSLTQINKAGLDEIALDHVFTIGASGSSAYTFQGEGLNGTVNNPTLYLTRGKTYRFENGSGGHPIRIQSTSGASGTAYNTGVTNNAGSGTVIVEVQHDAPDVLYYQCTSHAAMNGILYITGALADGGVTTAKLADDAVTDAKLANSINSAIAANTAKNTNATHTGDVTGSGSLTIASNAVTTAKIADDAVTAAKIANGAINTSAMLSGTVVDTANITDGNVTTAKIADEAVTLAKLPHGTGSNDGKFLRANNGADPTFETVTGTTINNNADNRLITGSGTANTLEGEANLTYDGSTLKVDGGLLEIAHSSCHVDFMESSTTNHRLRNGSGNFHIQRISDDKNTTTTQFLVDGGTGSVELFHNGTKKLSTQSGGICFNSDTAAANCLDDYEQGTFTPVPALTYNPSGRSITLGTSEGTYTKIGRFVHVEFRVRWTAISGSGAYNVGVNGLPFSADNTIHTSGGSGRSNVTGSMFVMENVNSTQINVIRKYNNTGPNESDDIAGFAVYHV